MVWCTDYGVAYVRRAKTVVRELGLGVGVTETEGYIDGRDLLLIYTDGGDLVRSETLEIGITRLMDGSDNEVRRKVKRMSDTFRDALMDGGSSFVMLQQFIDHVFTEINN